jgi:UDP-N-acetylmuramoyl-L-alanyl-D-glutamate--2,6-diaminopimelate ligase
MARCANLFYGNPSRELDLVGITGTNGKTTTAHLVHSVLNQQAPSLRMGTLSTAIGDRELEAEMTTPEAVDIQKTLHRAVKKGCQFGVMEVSSHALEFQRVFECHFPVAVFTNLSRDHLDFHKDLESYFNSKTMLFRQDHNPGLRFAVVNSDDPFSKRLVPSPCASVVSFGLARPSDVHLLRSEQTRAGIHLEIDLLGDTLSLESQLIGKHNLYNILAAATACRLLEITPETIQAGLARLKKVPGRFERVDVEAPFSVIIDFAHTPDALENVLNLAAETAQGRVICVFGCGGDRDRSKRPLMGEVVIRKADFAVITSDNPRSEVPLEIIKEIQAGIPPQAINFEVIPDRPEAIRYALQLARSGDLVLLAGKGHETYQEIRGRRIPFDEREIVREALC